MLKEKRFMYSLKPGINRFKMVFNEFPFPNDILKGQNHLWTKLKISIVGVKLVKDIVLLERH